MIPLKKIEVIEKKIKSECKKCSGVGCTECKSKVDRIKIYASANIPMDYWLLPFKDFKGDPNFKATITNKIENIDKLYEDGTSLGFVGNLGVGKTYAACCILKAAIIKGYSARYINMADIVSELMAHKLDNPNYLQDLINLDFLTIDEFSKRFVFASEKSEQLFGQTMETILRNRFQNHMPTILCSNTENIDNVLSEDFSRAFSSLSSKFLKVIYVGGKDFRREINKGK